MLKPFILVAALIVPAVAAAQPPQPDPIVREDAAVKVSNHVWVIPDNNVNGVPNVGFVVGNRATLVIDTGMGPRNGAIVLKEAQKLSKNQDIYVIATHFHPEHDLGIQAFPATAKVIRSLDQIKDIEEFGLQLAKTFASQSPVRAELLDGADFRAADITFAREHLLDLGGIRVRISAAGGTHTRGDTTVFVPGDAVLFAGDIVMPAFPAFASPYASVRSWLTVLDRLEAMKPARIVPAHGAMGDLAMLRGYREYFQTLQARARALKAEGRTADQTAETLQAEMQAKYPDRAQPGRVAGAARVAFNEVQ